MILNVCARYPAERILCKFFLLEVRIPERISVRISQVRISQVCCSLSWKVQMVMKSITKFTAKSTAKFTWTCGGNIHRFLLQSGKRNECSRFSVFFLISLFLFLGLLQAPIRKGPGHTIRTFPETEREPPRFGNPPPPYLNWVAKGVVQQHVS